MIRLSETVRIQYDNRTTTLRNAIIDGMSSNFIRAVYRDVNTIRIELNVIRSLIQRLQADSRPDTDEDQLSLTSWRFCPADKLKVISSSLLSLLTHAVFLSNVREKMNELLTKSDTRKEKEVILRYFPYTMLAFYFK